MCVFPRDILFSDSFLFQSQQARLATLYLPLFGLLQENVNRLNVKEVSPFTLNHSNNVREPPSGFDENMQPCAACAVVLILLNACTVSPQNGRDDPLLANNLMTPPRSSTFLDTSLHKDVFGVISGTGEPTQGCEKLRGKKLLFC